MVSVINAQTRPNLHRQKETCSVPGDECAWNFVPMNLNTEGFNKEMCENQNKSIIFLITMRNEFCNGLLRNAIAQNLMDASQLCVLVPFHTPASVLNSHFRWAIAQSRQRKGGIPRGHSPASAPCLFCKLLVPAYSQMRPQVPVYSKKYICVYQNPLDQVHIPEKNVCSCHLEKQTVYHRGW